MFDICFVRMGVSSSLSLNGTKQMDLSERLILHVLRRWEASGCVFHVLKTILNSL